MEHDEPAATPDDSRAAEPNQMLLLNSLAEENEALRRQIGEVVATAAANEKIWRHFAEIERILFRTRELDVLAEELLREIKKRFQPDQVILFLCHPDLLDRFFPDISDGSAPVSEGAWIVPFPAETGSALCAEASRPFLLSSEKITEFRACFPEAVSPVRSGVIIPLRIHEIVFGGLFLGSMDADRYRPRDGTDLLEQLGIKIALSMDNCLAYEKLKDLGVHDPVTGLFNYFQIHTVLEREFRKSRRNKEPLSVLVIDFNYVHGLEEFDSGKDVLRHAADLLSEILPEKESFLGRYGTDEFIVVLPGVAEEEAREVVPYLTQTIRKSPFNYRNTAILIQAAIGVGSLKEGTESKQDLLDAANRELRRLKSIHSESESPAESPD